MHSLKKATQLNGHDGTLLAYADGRWTVKLSSGETIRVQSANLRAIDERERAERERAKQEQERVDAELARKLHLEEKEKEAAARAEAEKKKKVLLSWMPRV